MSNHYKLNVNNTFQFEADQEKVSHLDAISVEGNKYHVLKNHTPFQVEMVSADFIRKNYTVKVNNNTYTVKIGDELDALIKEMGFEIGKSKQINAIKAPMPGLILEISVEVGQEVKENDQLLILEAMKMENSIASPRDGVIKSITVQKGNAVEKGQLLIEFE
ncbi:acetyl-CoA carboxylase biotin carboxyl carrier protein subunit [Flavobacterium sp. NRK F10]|uniref:Acetyl-CoA carboxylase biotin carboxyl carrier protein subunit n=1 Tax=Flavobacterium sediminis TaxID=2201181 RepID=A0A2U8QX33_9FLAO|nr:MULTISPECIES: acetyl-CoA carboxylase biotin carboxyl carrier protein subunit [Flavobacterium]AWM14444.1 acetyl-CoA carboxylase biotin carboxyl carrier protein subunit [Flavobacterium sediminis]MCO6175674.1 acetyl-CoA carboxylase biotin carboxyl carrier protein subunit [Flavobacterium sp. NRK F10]